MNASGSSRAPTASAAPEPDERWLEGLDEALASLPAAQQDAIRMRIVEDLTYDEAATRLDVSPEVLRTRVSRGLSTLRKHLFHPMETSR